MSWKVPYIFKLCINPQNDWFIFPIIDECIYCTYGIHPWLFPFACDLFNEFSFVYMFFAILKVMVFPSFWLLAWLYWDYDGEAWMCRHLRNLNILEIKWTNAAQCNIMRYIYNNSIWNIDSMTWYNTLNFLLYKYIIYNYIHTCIYIYNII